MAWRSLCKLKEVVVVQELHFKIYRISSIRYLFETTGICLTIFFSCFIFLIADCISLWKILPTDGETLRYRRMVMPFYPLSLDQGDEKGGNSPRLDDHVVSGGGDARRQSGYPTRRRLTTTTTTTTAAASAASSARAVRPCTGGRRRRGSGGILVLKEGEEAEEGSAALANGRRRDVGRPHARRMGPRRL